MTQDPGPSRQRGQHRGGQRRQQSDNALSRTENQQMSDREIVAADNARLGKLREMLMAGVDEYREHIENFLPKDCTFAKFRQIILMATERNPDILECTPRSILLAARSAAYDGLMPDGREGAMIPSNNKYEVRIPGTDSKRIFWRKEARWSPMIAGIRKQILKGGVVCDLITEMVYAEEVRQGRFKIRRGTDPSIEHEPIPVGADRGDAIGVYSVAYFFDGRRPTFEYMTREQVEAVRDAAQSGAVWKGKLWSEMWRKTVARRHRKSLPACNDIIDMEARELFPEFADNGSALEDHSTPATERPTRESVQQRLEDAQGTGNGTKMDFGFDGDDEAVLVESGEDASSADAPREHQQAAGQDQPESQGKAAENGQSSAGQKPKTPENGESANRSVPATLEEWESWASRVDAALNACPDAKAVNELRRQEADTIEKAIEPYAKQITDAFFDKLADFD